MPGYPYGWYPFMKPPPAPGETYRKVLSIITIVASSLLLLGGLGILLLLALLALAGSGQDLSAISLFVMAAIAALAGGGAGLYHSIRALMRRVSAPFSLPSFWLWLAVTLVTLGAGIALFALRQPTGSLALIEPLVLLSGIAPAFTILALGLQRLRVNVSWRHAWLALISGATLSISAASLLELLLALLLLGIASLKIDLTNFNPNDPSGTTAILVLVAVIAPLVEETTKQISGFFLLPRIKGPQEAFLVGLASGIGFAVMETTGYIGMAQADWVGIALGRVGAGLLHGMGAAMAGLGWYYLIKGKGTQGRWWRGFGCLAYAYLQHAIFNGGQVLLIQIRLLQNWHVDFFDLRLDITSVYAGFLYVAIVGVMLVVTGQLRRSTSSASLASSINQLAPRASMAASSIAPLTNTSDTQPASTADTASSNKLRSKGPGGGL
jgi:RsiW-degrading membrane proteinase PrsW (M82 family)